MNMIEVKTSELVGPVLDWAVAEAIGWKEPIFCVGRILYIEKDQYLMMEKPDPDEPDEVTDPFHFNHYEQWQPSRIWSQGGPLIEKFDIHLAAPVRSIGHYKNWHAQTINTHQQHGSLLVAAMRAIVAEKLGDTVSIPAELWRGEA